MSSMINVMIMIMIVMIIIMIVMMIIWTRGVVRKDGKATELALRADYLPYLRYLGTVVP